MYARLLDAISVVSMYRTQAAPENVSGIWSELCTRSKGAGLKKIPKSTTMEFDNKRPGASTAPTTRTPGSFPPPCRDPFRWIRLTAPPGTAGRLRDARPGRQCCQQDKGIRFVHSLVLYFKRLSDKTDC